jgi:hypothetical protein
MESVVTIGLGMLGPLARKISSVRVLFHDVGPVKTHGSSINSARSILRRRAHFE